MTDSKLITRGVVHWQKGGGAIFSPCERYRYSLWRRWGEYDGPMIAWIGLNPSTADETRNDPTVFRCMRRSRAMGYAGMFMLNLFAYRATDPVVMRAQEDPVGPANNRFLEFFTSPSVTGASVAAWGVHGTFKNRAAKVVELLESRPLLCLGTTKLGHPRHPLYVGYDVTLRPFQFRKDSKTC